jgi:hypothetical protein
MRRHAWAHISALATSALDAVREEAHADLNSALGFLARDLTSLLGQIEQHVLRNPGDWTAEDLFEHLGAFERATPGSGGSLRGWSPPA